MSMQTAIDELVKEGADDWVPIVGVTWIAKSVGGAATPEGIREFSLQLVAEVLRLGLMELGDLGTDGAAFRRWDLPSEAALRRVEREWRSLGRAPLTGDIFWLRNTPEGNRRGERLLPGRE